MEARKEVCSSSSNDSSTKLSKWDAIFAFVASTDDDLLEEIITGEKEKRRTSNEEYEEQKILEFKKMGFRALEGVGCFVQREIKEQLDLNRPPPPLAGLLINEAEVPAPEADNAKVGGKRTISIEDGFTSKRRTMPKDEDSTDYQHQVSYIQKTSRLSSITLRGSCSTSLRIDRVEEHRRRRRRVLGDHYQLKKDRSWYNEEPDRKPRHRVVKPPAQATQPAPKRIPADMEERILGRGGTGITWLSEKLLTESDTKRGQNRLFLPTDCFALLKSIMTDAERNEAHVITGKEVGLKTEVIGPDRRVWDMDFKYWPSVRKWVFSGQWSQVVDDLHLKAELDTVHIWCFRGQDRQLRFAITRTRTKKIDILQF